MHYGYVGKVAGFSESELLNGAGLAQTLTNGLGSIPASIVDTVRTLMNNPLSLSAVGKLVSLASDVYNIVHGSNPNASIFDPSSIDDPSDQTSIREGFDLHTRYPNGISREAFKAYIDSASSDLHKAYNYSV